MSTSVFEILIILYYIEFHMRNLHQIDKLNFFEALQLKVNF
jgi:hypothetical protein